MRLPFYFCSEPRSRFKIRGAAGASAVFAGNSNSLLSSRLPGHELMMRIAIRRALPGKSGWKGAQVLGFV